MQTPPKTKISVASIFFLLYYDTTIFSTNNHLLFNTQKEKKIKTDNATDSGL